MSATTRESQDLLQEIATAEEAYRSSKGQHGTGGTTMYRKGYLDALIQAGRLIGLSASAISTARWRGGAKADDLISAREPMPGMLNPTKQPPADDDERPVIRMEPLPGMRVDLPLRSEPTPAEIEKSKQVIDRAIKEITATKND
jgi:hypothetical protein